MNVAVAVARTVGPRAAPVSASSPLGTSRARIGTPEPLALLDQRRVVRGKRSRESDAEQSVDDERSAPSGRNVGGRRSTRGNEGTIGVARVRRKLAAVAAKDDGHVEECLAQPARDDEGVAAVVAGPREHEHGSVARADHVPRDVGRRQSGALHQRLPAGRGLHSAQFVGAIDRKQAHRNIIEPVRRRRRRAYNPVLRPSFRTCRTSSRCAGATRCRPSASPSSVPHSPRPARITPSPRSRPSTGISSKSNARSPLPSSRRSTGC